MGSGNVGGQMRAKDTKVMPLEATWIAGGTGACLRRHKSAAMGSG